QGERGRGVPQERRHHERAGLGGRGDADRGERRRGQHGSVPQRGADRDPRARREAGRGPVQTGRVAGAGHGGARAPDLPWNPRPITPRVTLQPMLVSWVVALAGCGWSFPEQQPCAEPHLFYSASDPSAVYFGCQPPAGWLETPADEASYGSAPRPAPKPGL